MVKYGPEAKLSMYELEGSLYVLSVLIACGTQFQVVVVPIFTII